MKKLTRKQLEKKLDRIVKEIVFLRDKECVTCPIWKSIKPDWEGHSVMTPGHYITRGAHSVKWDLRNVYKQCKTCNYVHEYHPEVLANYVLNVLGMKEFEQLVFDGNQAKKFYYGDLVELYEKLERELERLKLDQGYCNDGKL